MKKTIIILLYIIVLSVVIGSGCQSSSVPVETTATDDESIVSAALPETEDVTIFSTDTTVSDQPVLASTTPVVENTEVLKLACTVAEYIKVRDYESLASIVHPDYGVVFVPYSTVDFQSNQCFTAEEVALFGEDETKYVWGVTSGEGAPISMTPAEYFNSYVFNADYTAAPVIGFNSIMKTGNSLENVMDVFPDAQFVEFHFPSLNEANEGFDWCSLKIVFEDYEGEYKIVAIIHSEWTV